ncbi:hypothetical protein FRC19_001441 [Serendipita sp. 401]|nr:hypothetical protein FRC19_001441 [Serendipita sp. 401]KAG9055715.1 hypothetical protein FS842_001428 [Serendipita sp. 407]
MQTSQTVSQGSTHPLHDVAQVAWQFVVQYYTYMNDKPDQLHRFYTKNSHYRHGMEGEELDTLQGQTAIHKKFMDINYKGCKVFVNSVDAQPSANNGILVHVIGELSNNLEPWKKFVQVFFLAEQQNGYFVLNDNFRFLKEESFADDDDEEQGEVDTTAPVTAPVAQDPYPHANGYHHPSDPTHPQQPPSAPTIVAPAPVPAVSTPGPITPQESPLPPLAAETIPEIPRPRTPSPEPVPSTGPESAEPTVESILNPPADQAPSKSPSPIPPSLPASSEPAQPPVSIPAPYVPVVPTPSAPVPKTWASLAAANPSRWGQNVAQEVKGVSAAAPHAPSNPSHAQPLRDRPSTNTVAPGIDPNVQQGIVGSNKTSQQQSAYAAALAITTPLCFVKGVTENIPRQVFEQVLSTRFGPIKECEIIRSRACAFLEFKSVESAKKAIIASLSPEAGGEGGIRFDEEKYGSPARVNVETRKEKGDRPAPRPRGGAPSGSGEGRGSVGGGQQGSTPSTSGFRGRGGTRGRGDGSRGKP